MSERQAETQLDEAADFIDALPDFLSAILFGSRVRVDLHRQGLGFVSKKGFGMNCDCHPRKLGWASYTYLLL